MSTIKVDTIRPVTTDGSLTLQGDSSGAGVTGAKVFSDGSLGANSITDLAGIGAPDFPNGLTASGHILKVESSATISGSTALTTDQIVASPTFTTTVANSKILILGTLFVRASATSGNNFIYVKLKYSTDTLVDGYPIVGAFNAAPDLRGVAAFNYLHSPNVSTGTTLTYNVTINSNYADTVYIDSTTSPSKIIFMEIAP